MRLKLKEKPSEWWKFTAVMAVVAGLAAFLAVRRGFFSHDALEAVVLVLVSVLIIAAIRPIWFRGFYRIGMTASFHVGQVIGKVLLTVLFLLVVTPLGLCLRISGKDLLGFEAKSRNDILLAGVAASWTVGSTVLNSRSFLEPQAAAIEAPTDFVPHMSASILCHGKSPA